MGDTPVFSVEVGLRRFFFFSFFQNQIHIRQIRTFMTWQLLLQHFVDLCRFALLLPLNERLVVLGSDPGKIATLQRTLTR